MDTKQARNAGDRARFTTRIVFLEDPDVAEELERSAIEAGRSVAAEIRGRDPLLAERLGEDR
jgi:hypothetical protein